MSVQIVSGATSDLWTIDAASKAGRVTLYDSSGVEIKNPQQLVTYNAWTASAVTPPATPSDVFSITGSASKTLKIYRMSISTLQATAGVNNWFILKRSTANTGGTSAAVTAVPNDSNDAAASGTVLQYTANPTVGSLVGTVWSGRINSPAAGTAGVAGNLVTQVDFVSLFGRPIILRGTGQVLVWNFAGAALPTTMTFLAGVSWSEE